MAPRLSNEKIKKILDIPDDKELPDDWANDLIIKYRDWKEEIKKKLSIPEDGKLPDEWLSKLEVKTSAQIKVENELEKKKNEIIDLGITITGLNTRNEGLKDQITQLQTSLKNASDKATVDDLKDQIRLKNQTLEENKQAIKTAEWRQGTYQKEADDLHKKLLAEKNKQITEAEDYRNKWVKVVGDLTEETELRKKAVKALADYKVTHPDNNPPEKPKPSKPITGKEAITLLEKSKEIQQLLKTKPQTNLIVDVSTDDDVNKFKIEAKKFATTIVPYKCKSGHWVVVIIYNNKIGDCAFFSSLNWNKTNTPLIMQDANEIRGELIQKLTESICGKRKVSSDKLQNIRQQIFLQQEENIDSEIFPTGVIKKLLETDISIYSKTEIEDAEESQLNNIFNGLQITHEELVALKAKYDEIVRQAKQEQHP